MNKTKRLIKDIKILLLIIIIAIIFIIALNQPAYSYHYEYVDLDNNKGVAVSCSYMSTNYKGGQGSPVCELQDGTVKLVKEYKLISEKVESDE